VPEISATDLIRMRAQLFFEGPDRTRRLSRYWLLLPLSAVIAAAGVIGDSTATVIGAMIVAPLMIPILGTVLAVVLADRNNLLRSLTLLITGALAVVAIAWLIGIITDVPVNAATNTQVASRVTPRLIDLIAALATGAVGSIALAREDISDTLPGVAIAISLVPPLAVVGLTLESGEREQAIGAAILFVTNVSAILATGLAVMAAYRVTRLAATPTGDIKPVNRRRASIAIVLGLVVIAVPLTATSLSISDARTTQSEVTQVADEWADRNGWVIAGITTETDTVLIRATGPLPEPETVTLRAGLDAAGLGDTSVSIDLIPSRNVQLTPGS
jgi:uncharacterized hydrophobic protein (TIGR00271 family)